jgi:probable HAF family extracellular repeat protein
MSHWKLFGLALFAAFCLLGAAPGSAQAQECVNLGCAAEWSSGNVIILEPSGLESVAYGINDAGQVVGRTGGGVIVPTEWSGGNVIILGSSDGLGGGVASGINDAGQAVGYIYSPGAGPSFATEFSGGGGVIILGGTFTDALGINNVGQVVGTSGSSAVEWSGGREINLGLGAANAINDAGQVVGMNDGSATEWSHGRVVNLGGPQSVAYGINDRGQVVGVSTVDGVSVATEWSHGRVIDLGGPQSVAYGINDRGQVVGVSTVDGVSVATEWSHGRVIDLGPGIAYGINDYGQVVGESLGPPPAPVPEPSTWAMMLFGFAGLGYAGYRQAKHELAFNKLARAFASQVEALKRYRGGGEQKITAGLADIG